MQNLKLLLWGVCLAASLSLGLAQDHKPKKNNAVSAEEQQKLRKELLAKYDTNHDGKIDRNERKNVTTEDRVKLRKAGLIESRKKKKNDSNTAPEKPQTGDKNASVKTP